MEFQFGTNWAYYSHYVGDIFGAPLAIEGLMAFFLESTFVGLFFFGWDKLSKEKHLMVTFLVAVGSNLSALWILIANGWMQNPVGAEFNYHTMRMEMTSFTQLLFNPVAQVKFVHTVSAGYVTASMFVLGISAYYLLIGRDKTFAMRSIAIAAGFGLASALSVIVLGDESGYTAGEVQRAKLATIEAAWHTEKAPAAITAIGFPNEATQSTDYAIKIPYLLGLIATRSVDEKITGITELRDENEARIRDGMIAYSALEKLRAGDTSDETKAAFEKSKNDLGFGLLLKRYTQIVTDATEEQIKMAARDTIPKVAPMFWTFRIMVAAGFIILFIFSASFYYVAKRTIAEKKLAAEACAVQHSATMDCRRNGLDSRRIRQAAMDDQRHPADQPEHLQPRCFQCVFQPRRIRRLLHPAAGGRTVFDVQVCTPWPAESAYRPVRQHIRRRP